MNKIKFRQIHLDFHTSKYISGIGDKFDADEFVDTLKKAHVNSINLFSKCHHGMFYYDTKIGTKHPNLKCNLLKLQIDACKKNDIDAYIYTCVAWNEDWAYRHPEWLQINSLGQLGTKPALNDNYYNWNYICLNKTEYVNILMQEIKETYENFKPKGYWIDIVIQNKCVCHDCLADMENLGLDPHNIHDIEKHDRIVEIDFANKIYSYIKSLDSNLEVYFNGFVYDMDLRNDEFLSANRKRQYNTHIDIESLPSGEWGYTHFPIVVNYLNKYDKELTMMNGKFHLAWGDFGTLRNQEALEYECFRAIANGAKCCIGDQLHPNGKIDKSVYARIGKIYESIEKKEEYLDSLKVSEIGVFTTKKVLDNTGFGATAANNCDEGVYRILLENKYLFDFIDFTDDVSKYKLLILPDHVEINEIVAEKINDYVKNGGSIIISGKSALDKNNQFLINDMGVKFLGDAEYHPRYLRVENNNLGNIETMDYVQYQKGYDVAVEDANVLAFVVNPYFNRNYKFFCSHRQTPPNDITNIPAITRKGNIIYISHPLFSDYAISGNKFSKDCVNECIKMLLPNPIIKTNLPNCSECTLRRQSNRYVLHVLQYAITRRCKELDTIDDSVTSVNNKIFVRLGEKVKNVYLAPEKDNVEYKFSNGYVEIDIPKLTGHQMIVLEI